MKLETKKGLTIGVAITVFSTPDGRKFLQIPLGRVSIRNGAARFIIEKLAYHWDETPVPAEKLTCNDLKLGDELTLKELKELGV